jgi:hypothetical protein
VAVVEAAGRVGEEVGTEVPFVAVVVAEDSVRRRISGLFESPTIGNTTYLMLDRAVMIEVAQSGASVQARR